MNYNNKTRQLYNLKTNALNAIFDLQCALEKGDGHSADVLAFLQELTNNSKTNQRMVWHCCNCGQKVFIDPGNSVCDFCGKVEWLNRVANY